MRLGFAAFYAQGYALAQRLAQVLGGTATPLRGRLPFA